MYLDELADIQLGYPFRSRLEPDPKGDVFVIQMKDVDDANLLHVENSVRLALPKRGEHHLLRPGDLLLRSRGRSNGVALVADGLPPAILAAPMIRIRPDTSKVLPAYLNWFMNSPAGQAQIAAKAEGTLVMMISVDEIKSLEVPLPSLERQAAIADVAQLAQREHQLLSEIAGLRERTTHHILMNEAKKATP
ncbi:MAG: restriction endonuclease subunit S [Pseudomonadota bacterium]